MACCQASAPSQDRAPAPPRPSDEFGPTWGLPLAVAAPIDLSTAGEFRHGLSAVGQASDSSSSLLALAIRFNL